MFPGGGFYHATKFAVEAIGDALRFEVASFGVDVVVIEARLIRTHFGDNILENLEGISETDRAEEELNRAVATATKWDGSLTTQFPQPGR